MFTGIIETTGTLLDNTNNKITIGNVADSNFLSDMKLGMSIALNGVCLTLTKFEDKKMYFEVIPETLEKTNLGDIALGKKINLERTMPANGRFDGHIVQGHVDTTTTVCKIYEEGNAHMLEFKALPKSLAKYMVKKGSVCMNGISLTLIDVNDEYFSIGIIPHTWEVTMLHELQVGDTVNIEVDVIAKYVEKMMTFNS